MRPDGEEDRDERADAEQRGEPISPRGDQQDQPGERCDRRRPAEERELLTPRVVDVARDEVAPVRRVVPHLVERPSARLCRARDHRLADEDPAADRGQRREPDPRVRTAEADDRVRNEERNRPEREMHLARERNRRERCPGEREPPGRAPPCAFDRPQRERQQDGNRPEQVADALGDAVRRDRERKAADECRRAREPELAQPRAREQPGERVAHDLHCVPREDEAEQRAERPEQEAERPAGEIGLRAGFRAKRERIEPRCVAVLELVADEPPVIQGLQVIARRRLAVSRGASGEERGARVKDGGPRRRNAGGDVQHACERHIARAAASSTSKFGSSPVP